MIRASALRASRSESPGAKRRRSLADRRMALYLASTSLLGFLWSALWFFELRSAGIKPEQWDFRGLYSVLWLVWHGHGSYMSDPSALSALAHVGPHHAVARYIAYSPLYPPFAAAVLAPLGALSYVNAYLIWLGLNSLFLSAALWLLTEYIPLAGRARFAFTFAAVFFWPTLIGLLQGQRSPLLLLLLASALAASARAKDGTAGVALALTLVKPLFFPPFLVVLAAKQRWRATVWFGGASALLLMIPVIVFGPAMTLGFIHVLVQAMGWHDASHPGYSPGLQYSLSGQIETFLPQPTATAAVAALWVVAMASVALVARLQPLDRALGFAAAAAVLISPHLLVHDLTLVIIPMAVALRWRHQGSPALSALLAVLYCSPLFDTVVPHPVNVKLSVLCTLLLAVWLALPRASIAESSVPSVISRAPRAAEELA